MFFNSCGPLRSHFIVHVLMIIRFVLLWSMQRVDHFTVVSWNLELTFLCFIAKTISFLNDNRWQSDEKMSCKNGNA